MEVWQLSIRLAFVKGETVKRRTYLKTILAAGAVSVAGAADAAHPIQLHVDLAVDPAKEKEMLHNFETIFHPAAVKYPGYIDVKMIKLRSALMGTAPAGVNYRFVLTYQSEEMRQKWVASAIHRKVWPTIENTLSSKNYTVLLFDVA
jgi:antibiotic biosynthesis monooxygenase (ABM) superfamily enzyme